MQKRHSINRKLLPSSRPLVRGESLWQCAARSALLAAHHVPSPISTRKFWVNLLIPEFNPLWFWQSMDPAESGSSISSELDTDPIRFQGFVDQKLRKKQQNFFFFFIKKCNLLLPWPPLRRSMLQKKPQKRVSSTSKKEIKPSWIRVRPGYGSGSTTLDSGFSDRDKSILISNLFFTYRYPDLFLETIRYRIFIEDRKHRNLKKEDEDLGIRITKT